MSSNLASLAFMPTIKLKPSLGMLSNMIAMVMVVGLPVAGNPSLALPTIPKGSGLCGVKKALIRSVKHGLCGTIGRRFAPTG